MLTQLVESDVDAWSAAVVVFLYILLL